MSELHRRDSPERKHYTVDRKSLVNIKPTLLYTGILSKSQDWRDSQHSHEFLEILFVLDGRGVVEIAGRPFTIAKHDIVIYNANVIHFEQSSSEEPLEVDFFAFDKIQLKDLPANCLLPENANCIFNAGSLAPIFKQCFDVMHDEISTKDEFYAEIVKDGSHALLMYVFRIISRTLNTSTLLNKDNILNTVLPYINKNFMNNLSLNDIAAECFVNKYYLSHVFTESLGMSIGQYIRSKKIALTQSRIIETNLPISEIASEYGFHDLTYFDRLFKKETGLTPLQYRKAHRSGK